MVVSSQNGTKWKRACAAPFAGKDSAVLLRVTLLGLK